MIESYRKAGEIVRKVREESKELIKEGNRLLDVAEFIEGKILEYGGGIAFPVNISLNNIAAHYTPPAGDESVFKKNDYVKIDMGVHIDGYIADTAYTIKVGEENDPLVKAAEEALENAISVVKDGVKTSEIGKSIEDTIKKYGFNPIENLSGHTLDRYIQHAQPSIPNVETPYGETLKKGCVIAIEPFATTGVGKVVDDERAFIFRFLGERPVRLASAKKMMIGIKKKYGELPFAERWVAPTRKDIFILKTLIRYGAVYPYYILKEKTGKEVSQAEHTVLITEEGCEILT